MNKRHILLTALGLFLVIVILAGIKALQIFSLMSAGKAMVEPPIAVSSMTVKPYQWESTLRSIGSLEAAKGLDVTADLSGRIVKIHFDAGSEVVEGDLLVQQEVSTEKAQLRAAQSRAVLEKNNFNRVSQLYNRKVASQSEYDSAKNAYQSAVADADNIRAAIEKKSIRAPFDGRLGIRLVNLGQTIAAGQTVVSLQATNKMFANFFLPQQHISKLSKGLTVRVTSDAVPAKTFEGTINAINPEINSDSRSVEIQAILANPDNELLPGMFVNIHVVLPDNQRVLIIPVTAVQYSTYGDSVFVIEAAPPANSPQETDDDSKEPAKDQLVAHQKFVRLGETRGDYVVVEKGLFEGQQVASMGAFKLSPNAPVIINNTVVPDFSLSPELPDQ